MPDGEDIKRLGERIAARGDLVEAAWVSYRLHAIPPNFDPGDVDIMRVAFYAGASFVFSDITTRLADDGYSPPAALLACLMKMDRELRNYVDDMDGRDMSPGGSFRG